MKSTETSPSPHVLKANDNVEEGPNLMRTGLA